MSDEQIKSMIKTQEMCLEAGIIISGTNGAQTKKWRLERIEYLQSLLTEEPKKKRKRRNANTNN